MSEEITMEHERRDGRGVLKLVEAGQSIAHLTYRRPGPAQLTITYVEVDSAQRGRGLAKRLVKAMVEYRDELEAQMDATCGVARAILVKMGEL